MGDLKSTDTSGSSFMFCRTFFPPSLFKEKKKKRFSSFSEAGRKFTTVILRLLGDAIEMLRIGLLTHQSPDFSTLKHVLLKPTNKRENTKNEFSGEKGVKRLCK